MKVERTTRGIDELSTDLLVVTLFETERPPRGICGLADWRLNGFLSRAILSGSVSGKKEEFVLVPLHHRLPARRMILVGLGQKQDFTLQAARSAALKIGKSIRGLSVSDVAISFPLASDDRSGAETELAVFDVFRQCELPEGFLVHWLPPIPSAYLPFPADLHMGTKVEISRAV